jgi:hypothetical protein
MGFGDIGIDFELRCLIATVEQSLAVRSCAGSATSASKFPPRLARSSAWSASGRMTTGLADRYPHDRVRYTAATAPAGGSPRTTGLT